MTALVPESFAWLHAETKDEKLIKSVKTIARINNKEIPTSVILIHEKKAVETKKTRFFLLFCPLNILIRTLPLAVGWFTVGLVYYGVSLAAGDLTGNPYRDFILLSTVEFPAAAAATFIAMRFGRKRAVIIPLFCSGICLLVIALLPTLPGYTIARLLLGIAGKFFASITFDAIYTWCAELYPTVLRSKAAGFFNFSAYVGNMLAPWLGVWLRHVHVSAPYFVMGGSAVLSALLMFHLPETKGCDLTECSFSNQDGRRRRVHDVSLTETIPE